MRELLKREVFFFAQYFLIACIAAVLGHYAWENAQVVSSLDNVEGAQAAVNVKEMMAALWRDYFRWVFGAFASLSAVRLLIVLLLYRAKQGVA